MATTTTNTEPVILALDPALACGYALVCGDEVLESGVRDFKKKRDDLGPHPGSLPWAVDAFISHEMAALYQIEAVGCEAPAGVRGLETVRNHYVFQIISQLYAYAADVPWLSCHPSTLKKWATGSGKATKEQMIEAAIQKWWPTNWAADPSGQTVPRGQPNTLDDNEADALLLAAWAQEQLAKEAE